jgi:UDP-N-acetylmuramoylalanine--D-glutamate ligase
MKIAILGFGREGKSVLKFLKKNNPRADIKILDQKFDKNYLKNLSSFDIIFRSPGVPYNLSEIQKALKAGVKFSSATALFFNEAKKISCKIIGITGTKGKGTTATLLYKILKACGKNVYLAGNIGKPAIELLSKIRINQPNPHKSAFVILELSSFQLQDMKVSPQIAVVLDVFPDHLDLHRNLQEYFDAKTNIARWQKKSDKIFYFSDNRRSKWLARKSRAKKYPVSARNFKLLKQEDLEIPGQHNFRNAVMAASVALSLGCPKNKIIRIVRNFRGNEHRLELVRTIRINQLNQHESASIKFYNDSASTNPQTAAAAIRAFKQPKILISGGKDKGLNYSPLAKALKNSNTKLVILFGENKNKIKRQVTRDKRQEVVLVKDLKSSVNLAYKTAKNLLKSMVNGQWSSVNILFSPASASFDMFKDYADRGEKFKELVKKLKH